MQLHLQNIYRYGSSSYIKAVKVTGGKDLVSCLRVDCLRLKGSPAVMLL